MARRASSVLCTLAVAVTVAACGGGGDDGDDGDDVPPTGAITARIDHYDYHFDLDTRQATVTIGATVEVAGDCLTLPFRADALGAVSIDGVAAVSADVASEKLKVCGTGYPIDHALSIDAAMQIPMTTWADSDVGYSVTDDRFGNPMYYLVSWIGGCDRFGPCDNRPDRFATYTFVVTHPADVTVRCPGTITDVDATTTKCDFGFPGGPTYSTFGVIGTKGWTTSTYDFSGLAVELYDHTGTGIAARIIPAFHAGFIDFMRAHFGAFPFGTDLRVLTGPTYWSGFEHPGNIVLADTLADPPRPGEIHYADPVAHILNHEMAHQWAGDQTTLSGTYDFVWKESMAEYLSYVYEDQTDPTQAVATARLWKASANGARYYPVPDDHPTLLDYYGDVYGPGPMILFHQVELLSSRAAVMTALESLLGQAHAIGVADVEAALESSTGLDLTAYFDAWMHGTGAPEWPRFSTTFSAGTLSVTQTNQAAGVKPCKFRVELRGGAGEAMKVDVDTFTNGPDQQIPVTPGFAVTTVALDPDYDCLVFQSAFTVTNPPRPRPWLSAPSR